MDLLFLIGLLIKTLEYLIADASLFDISDLKSSGRILWGVAFTLAIIKMIKIGIASKYFGPIILSINAMMKDVGMFLITFFVIMLAFSCGVSYMFNYLQVILATIVRMIHKVYLRTLRWPQAPARVAYSPISSGFCYRLGQSESGLLHLNIFNLPYFILNNDILFSAISRKS